MAHGVVVWWAKYHLISLKYTNYILKLEILAAKMKALVPPPFNTWVGMVELPIGVVVECVLFPKLNATTCSLKPTIGTVFPMIPAIFF